MIELLEKEISKFRDQEQRFNHLRELLQVLILKICHDDGFFGHLVFTGETALRMLFDLRRFSEDLDFFLVREKGFEFTRFRRTIRNRLAQYGVPADVTEKGRAVVRRLDVKFTSILQALSLPARRAEKLFVRLEIDTNPPAGGRTEISLINRMFMFQVAHFDLSSLFATKIPACFLRRYTKGRNFYDLLWYLTRKVEPNYELLNNAVRQVQRADILRIDRTNMATFLARRLEQVDFRMVRRDV